MNERVQRYLDGELRREELTAEELRDIAPYEAMIRETERASRSIEVPDLTGGVRARIAVVQPPRNSRGITAALRTIAGWLWAPRPVRFRPAYGLIASALLLFLIAPVNAPETTPTPGKVFVQFRLDAPHAQSVRLAGTFNGWQPTYALQQVKPGTWSILIPLDPGVYNYAFVVNQGEWLADPAAPAVADGFGGVNSRLSVLLPTEL